MTTKPLTDQGKKKALFHSPPSIHLLDTEIQTRFSRFQNELQQLAQKIGELESEADEHE